jgi:hypothetical protein
MAEDQIMEHAVDLFRQLFAEFDGDGCTSWSLDATQILAESLFHEDMHLARSDGEGLPKEEFLDILRVLRKSMVKVQVQKMMKRTPAAAKHENSTIVDCTMLFHLPESSTVTRVFHLKVELSVREGQIWRMHLKDATSPYVFNVLVMQSKIRSILNNDGMANQLGA